MKQKIIDVSAWQGVIDWERAKGSIDGAILRCGFGGDDSRQDDRYFARNASECTRLGIPFGVYLYSYATTAAKAASEATHILRLIAPYKLTYPVYLDVEEENAAARAFAGEACRIVGERITGAGYRFGVYANLNWWNSYLVGLDQYSKWVAQYHRECTYRKPYDMWQYSCQGSVPGIAGQVDLNECYRDFTAEAGTKTLEVLAREVIRGQWGNGEERKQRLTGAGYDYWAVQARVNALLR